MRPRALLDLCQNRDEDFFPEISLGLTAVFENAQRIQGHAKILYEAKAFQGFNILRGICEEEISKFYILLDAVRCPRKPPELLSRQLRRFYNHLSRGIYAQIYNAVLLRKKEIIRSVEFYRQQYYLDGPNSYDWVFYNYILAERERHIYVDYMHTDEGHIWQEPLELGEMFFASSGIPHITIAQAFLDSGCTEPHALKVIADKWRALEGICEFSSREISQANKESLSELEAQGLLKAQSDENHREIIDNWQLPLHDVELELEEVDRDELRKKGEESFYRDMYGDEVFSY